MYQLLKLMYQIFDVQKTKEEGGEAEAWATKAAIEMGRAEYMLAVHMPVVNKVITYFLFFKFSKEKYQWWVMISTNFSSHRNYFYT